jgi:hypothetical protein
MKSENYTGKWRGRNRSIEKGSGGRKTEENDISARTNSKKYKETDLKR